MTCSAMHLSIQSALALTIFAGTLTLGPSEAYAVVCAKGVVRAGCAGPNGAAVVGPHGAAAATTNGTAVRAPVAACHYVVVNGVRVRRCS
jgi:hypothetical protein